MHTKNSDGIYLFDIHLQRSFWTANNLIKHLNINYELHFIHFSKILTFLISSLIPWEGTDSKSHSSPSINVTNHKMNDVIEPDTTNHPNILFIMHSVCWLFSHVWENMQNDRVCIRLSTYKCNAMEMLTTSCSSNWIDWWSDWRRI